MAQQLFPLAPRNAYIMWALLSLLWPFIGATLVRKGEEGVVFSDPWFGKIRSSCVERFNSCLTTGGLPPALALPLLPHEVLEGMSDSSPYRGSNHSTHYFKWSWEELENARSYVVLQVRIPSWNNVIQDVLCTTQNISSSLGEASDRLSLVISSASEAVASAFIAVLVWLTRWMIIAMYHVCVVWTFYLLYIIYHCLVNGAVLPLLYWVGMFSIASWACKKNPTIAALVKLLTAPVWTATVIFLACPIMTLNCLKALTSSVSQLLWKISLPVRMIILLILRFPSIVHQTLTETATIEGRKAFINERSLANGQKPILLEREQRKCIVSFADKDFRPIGFGSYIKTWAGLRGIWTPKHVVQDSIWAERRFP